MVPVTSGVVQEPPRRLGQTPSQQPGWRVWARRALILVLLLAVTGGFAAAAHGARHRPRELAYAVVVYVLLVLLMCCVVRLEQLRRRDPAAASAGERRRVRIAVWVVSVTLSNTFASCVADLMPVLVLKLDVWAVAAVVLGIAFYHLFCSKDEAGCCNAEHVRGQADDDAGRRPERALHGLSPEEKV